MTDVRSPGWSRRAAALLALPLLVSCSDGTDCDTTNPLMPVCTTDGGPDEPRIVFISNRDWGMRTDLLDVYTMTSRGTDIHRLTDHGWADLPRWSPDGNRIAYVRIDENWTPAAPYQRLIVIDAEGGNARDISGDPTVSDGYPAWSPDGRRIAFHSNRHNTQGGALRSIYVMDADGGNVVRLTHNNAWNDRAPHWSPDGSKIVFNSTRAGSVHIFVMNADGSDVRQLTTAGQNAWPNWSPDGTRISFRSVRMTDGEPDNGLYIINLDGTGERNLTKAGTMEDMYSSWSADGRYIYFCSTRTGMHVWRVTVADGDVRAVTNPGSMTMEAEPNARWPRSFAP